jgi:hypothetical protein
VADRLAAVKRHTAALLSLRWRTLGSSLFGLVLVVGCSTWGEVKPTPHIYVEGRKGTKLCQSLGPEVADDPAWRKTLDNGFRAGFGRSFTLADTPATADQTLEIARADLGKIDTASSLISMTEIRYQARLRDKSGQIVATSAWTVSAPDRKGAVEAMYEAISQNFFGQGTAAACSAAGAACTTSTACCSGSCRDRLCQCAALGMVCASDALCCSGKCANGNCQ